MSGILQGLLASLAAVLPPELYGWGRNTSYGVIGDNTIINRSSPVQVGGGILWDQVSTSRFNTTALTTNGELYGWGASPAGTISYLRSSPVQIGSLTTWSNLSSGSGGAIKSDGTMWSWGVNTNGIVGDGTQTNRVSPVQIGSFANWSQMSRGAAGQASGAITTDNKLYTWGINQFGTLGLNVSANPYTMSLRSSPVQVGALTNWAQVSMNDYQSAAVKTDGTLWSWGANTGGFGKVGDGTSTHRSSPVQIGALTDWALVESGARSKFAIKTTGTLWSWGIDYAGALGLNTSGVDKGSPVQIGALTNWLSVSAGQFQASAVKTDGTLWAWGSNGNGKLGDGTTVYRSSPVQIGALTDWSVSSSKWSNTAAILVK